MRAHTVRLALCVTLCYSVLLCTTLYHAVSSNNRKLDVLEKRLEECTELVSHLVVVISVVVFSAAAAAENTTTDHEFFELKLLFHKIASGASGASGSPVQPFVWKNWGKDSQSGADHLEKLL